MLTLCAAERDLLHIFFKLFDVKKWNSGVSVQLKIRDMFSRFT